MSMLPRRIVPVAVVSLVLGVLIIVLPQCVAHREAPNPGIFYDTSDAKNSRTIEVLINDRDVETAEFFEDIEGGMQSEAAKYDFHVHVAYIDKKDLSGQIRGIISGDFLAVVLITNIPSANNYEAALDRAERTALREHRTATRLFATNFPHPDLARHLTATIMSDDKAGGAQAADLMCYVLGSNGGSVAVLDSYNLTDAEPYYPPASMGLRSSWKGLRVNFGRNAGARRLLKIGILAVTRSLRLIRSRKSLTTTELSR